MFDSIIGNEGNKIILENAIKTRNITHAYMFVGQDGIGKKLFAIEFAKNILSSKSLENNPDYTIIEPEGNSIKIEKIRQLIEKAYEKPIVSDKKIYIINDADKMTKEAANCMLKILEEPPEYIHIILIVSNESLVLNTIKSRCSKIFFNKIENTILKKYFNFENISDNMLYLINGSIAKAEKIKKNAEIYDTIERIVMNTKKANILDFFKEAQSMYLIKEELESVFEYMNVLFLEQAKKSGNIKYLNCINHIENARVNIARNANSQMNIDMLLFKIYDEVNK